MNSYDRLSANYTRLMIKYKKLEQTRFSKQQVRQHVIDGFIAGYHEVARNHGQLLTDIKWNELDPKFTKTIHKKAEDLAKSMVA